MKTERKSNLVSERETKKKYTSGKSVENLYYTFMNEYNQTNMLKKKTGNREGTTNNNEYGKKGKSSFLENPSVIICYC